MELRKKRRVVVVQGAAQVALASLERSTRWEDQQILKSLRRALDLLKGDAWAGDSIKYDIWRKTPLSSLPNLYRMELSQFWRLLYYVKGDSEMIVIVVFEICDHEQYDKILRYRKN